MVGASGPQGATYQGVGYMPNSELSEMSWVEDIHDLSFDELRELPSRVQMGIDLSIFE